jgi:lysozyme
MTEPAKKGTATWVAVCVACVGSFEGLRQVAYYDPVRIPTYCFGETQRPDGSPVQMGDRATTEECREMLGERVQEFGRGVDSCVKVPLPPARKAAFVSFSYNVGTGAFCKSTLVKRLNAGDTVGACDELLRWTTAKGVKLPGLVKRREAERAMCMEGLA